MNKVFKMILTQFFLLKKHFYLVYYLKYRLHTFLEAPGPLVRSQALGGLPEGFPEHLGRPFPGATLVL